MWHPHRAQSREVLVFFQTDPEGSGGIADHLWSSPCPEVIQRTRPPELGAYVRLGEMRVPEGHRQGFMSEDLSHQLQVASLSEDGRSRVVAEGVGADLVRQPGPHRETVEDVCPVVLCKRASLPVSKQKVLRMSVTALGQPSPQRLRRLRPEEPHAILATFAAPHGEVAGGKVHVLDP